MLIKQRPNNYKKSMGMTFIEVLIAFLILATGILGAVAMQASAKKGSFDAMQRSIASSLAQDILERMRANDSSDSFLDAYNGTDYGASLNSEPQRCNTVATACSPAQMVTNDLYEWELSLMGADVKNGTANNGGLVGANACIQHSNNTVVVVISWEGREETTDGASDNIAFAKTCGTSNTQRRQVVVDGFIF